MILIWKSHFYYYNLGILKALKLEKKKGRNCVHFDLNNKMADLPTNGILLS